MTERRTVFEQATYWLTPAGVYFLVGVLFLYSGKSKLRRKSLLLAALSLALLTFACLSFGQTSTGNNAGTASLYTYFALTAIIYPLAARLPPNRS